MGDEELNFSEEEAKCWADDPRNQAQQGLTLSHPLAFCLLTVIATVVFIWLAIALGAQHQSELQHISETSSLVR
jgi:type VI protein secretion system component VasF